MTENMQMDLLSIGIPIIRVFVKQPGRLLYSKNFDGRNAGAQVALMYTPKLAERSAKLVLNSGGAGGSQRKLYRANAPLARWERYRRCHLLK
jgi:hypothetical protein